MFGLSQKQPRTRAGVNIRLSDNPSGVKGPSDTHSRAGHRTQLLQIPANHTYTHTLLLEHRGTGPGLTGIQTSSVLFRPVHLPLFNHTLQIFAPGFGPPTSSRILKLCPFDGKTLCLSYRKNVGRVNSNK